MATANAHVETAHFRIQGIVMFLKLRDTVLILLGAKSR